MDQSEVYVTPTTVRRRFEEVPALLQQAQPFEVNRALKPLLGKRGITLERRKSSDGEERYWMVGSINVAKAVGLPRGDTLMHSTGIRHEIDLELELK